MRYRVQLWRTSVSRKADVEHVVRALNVEDAIYSLMKTLDWGYASSALAYPVDKEAENISPENWRRRVRCRISGKASCITDNFWHSPLSM